MDTYEVKFYMKKINPGIENNVFAANRIPRRVNTPFSMISNLDPDTKPGSHWVTISINENGVGEYFDSYGRKPSGHHKMFLTRNTKRWFYNNIKLQSYLTSVCGEYCLVYLYFKHKGIPMLEFLKRFIDDSLCNDLLIREMFKCIFN